MKIGDYRSSVYQRENGFLVVLSNYKNMPKMVDNEVVGFIKGYPKCLFYFSLGIGHTNIKSPRFKTLLEGGLLRIGSEFINSTGCINIE